MAYQIKYDVVETNSERNGGFCNVHYGTTNAHNFAGDLTQWHTYACELNSEGVVFYLDGNVTKKLTGDYVRSKYPHRLGIQLDVSSDGGPGPTPTCSSIGSASRSSSDTDARATRSPRPRS